MRTIVLALLVSAAALAPVAAHAYADAPPAPAASDAGILARLNAGAPGNTPIGTPTALERYVRLDDGAFAWSLEQSTRLLPPQSPVAGTWHTLKLTSQVWRTKEEVDRPEWNHYVGIWIPDALASDRPILFIGGGRRKTEPPKTPPGELRMLSQAGAIVVSIDNVPNQPLKLDTDPADRNEDGLVARTWVRAAQTGDPTWIARFPMVKAAVKAIDATEQFLAKHPPTGLTVAGKPLGDKPFTPGPWLVVGGSKRGWTAWLTAAIDTRVGALAPLVIDMLDLPAQMRHHHAAYGFWSPALNDYVETGITDRFSRTGATVDPLLAGVLAHDDPIAWLPRVGAKPKLLINAAGDEFFLPDSSRFYESRLPAPWALRYQPNSGHNLRDTSTPQELIAFYRLWAAGKPLPALTWTAGPIQAGSQSITVTTGEKPQRVRVWQAAAKARDFRIGEIGKTAWTATDLQPTGDDPTRFTATLAAPASGYAAHLVEVTYAPIAEGVAPLMLTTRVFVLPETLPHAGK